MNVGMTVTRLIARPMLASMFVAGGVSALRNAEAAADRAKPVAETMVPVAQGVARRVAPGLSVPTDPKTLVRVNAVAQIAAGLALATGRVPRLSALTLAATLVPTTAAGHRFWEESDPQARANQQTHFFKNVSMLGGLLIAGVDTDGRPGLAWRAKHAASDISREAKHVRKAARREAKLARKSI